MPPNTEKYQRLADLLIEPRERLDVELKSWLNLRGDKNDKATLAKSILALANHGGGYVLIGLDETETGGIESKGRPATLDDYSQDIINGIVDSYCDPSFHCTVEVHADPDGALFPIVVVPGGHKVPILSKRGGPNGHALISNEIYMRRPGPQSASPQNSNDWNELLSRCFANRRDETLDLIRGAFTGQEAASPEATTDEPIALDGWVSDCLRRWAALTDGLPANAGPKFPNGYYLFAYSIEGDVRQMQLPELKRTVEESVVRHTGWPPFWVPTRDGIAPYANDGAIECWLGNDDRTPPEQRDPAYSDFWRVSPAGLALIMRGFQEDGEEAPHERGDDYAAGKIFDISLPIWRIGECLLQAASLAEKITEGHSSVRVHVTYVGLDGRRLGDISGGRHMPLQRIARQNEITLSTHVETARIEPNLPEVVNNLLSPLYGLFDFFELPEVLVRDELDRMRRR